MLDVGWTELLLIGVVALIVIGPKDLPVMFHTLGRITARARGMAREFSSAMEDAAKASGVHEVTKDLRDLQKIASPRSMGLDALSRAADKFEKWDPLEPVRDAAVTAVPDPAAPVPPAARPVTPPAGPDATEAAAVAAPAGDPGATASGLSPDASSAERGVASGIQHQPGARRLHAVRRKPPTGADD